MKSFSLLTCAILASNTYAFSDADQQKDAPQDPCMLQGEPLTCYGPAYNAPAVTNVNHKDWKLRPSEATGFIDASFTYWYAGEEGLTVASNGVINSGTNYFAENTTTLFQSNNYKPGFKVGAGIVGYHDWKLAAEYTWYRGTHSTHSGSPLSATVPTAGTAAAATGTAVWVVDDWFLQGTPSQALSGPSVSSKWHLAMDIADLVAGRPMYHGRHFTVSPYAGLRAAFIRQSMTVNLTESTELFSGALTTQPIESRNSSHSWSIGPRIGGEGQWLLPMGFRLESNAAVSLLYTQYTSVKHSEDAAATTFNAGPYTASYSNYNCVRPELDLGLGFGWGKYSSSQDFHFDLSADYDFMMFWNQNMMRKLLDDTLTGTSPSSSNLYLHGLTVTARFDF